MSTEMGYHYTTLDRWEIIQREGLVPYPIRHDICMQGGYDRLDAIWVWQEDMSGLDELGSVLWQFVNKVNPEVVKLRVRYSKDDIVPFARMPEPLEIHHTGSLAEFRYHLDSPKSYLVNAIIPPESIELVRTYDVRSVIA